MGDSSLLRVDRFAEARGPELQSLLAALQDPGKTSTVEAGSFEIPAHARRRTRSHSRYKHRYWRHKEPQKKTNSRKGSGGRNASAQDEQGDDLDEDQKSKERKRELKLASLSRRVRRRIEHQDIVKGKRSLSRDGTRRLATHVWHAKRFYMAKRWGYWLAAGLPGRGRCAATVLGWISRGAVLHDASYCNAIQLEGPQDELSQVMSLVLEPTGSGSFSRFPCYVDAMAHHCEEMPVSAIAPVRVMFLSKLGKVWIHVHAAAFNDVLEALQTACQGLSNVACNSREGELATIEIFGKETSQLLGKVIKSSDKLLDQLPKHACLEMEVDDPRKVANNYSPVPLESDIIPDDSFTSSAKTTTNLESPYSATYWRGVMDQSPKTEERNVSCLCGPSSAVEPPLSDKTVSRWQHHRRLSHFRMDGKNFELTNWKKCPMLLVKHDRKTLTGCSLVLPASWLHTIWMSLVLSGARVIGQAERRWIMTHACIPSFPHDFPDCPSYEKLWDRERLESTSITAENRPLEKCFVPRSSPMLSASLRLHHLNISQLKPPAVSSWTMPTTSGSCYLPVLVRAARKGVPEEGCTLCAPVSQDFRAWLDREQKWQGVDITNKDKVETRDRIGFVTSAAPWRSGVAAIGFCDATQLSKLRTWQRDASADDSLGLLVLFHNPNSSKLRPALVSLTLDIQD